MAYLIDRRNNSRDRRAGGNRGRSGGESRQMFKATCDSCGNNCEVPFRPTEGKPVYCSDCFRKNQPSDDRRDDRRSDSRFASRSHNDGQRNMSEQRSNPSQAEFKGQFLELNNKLDKILKLLQPEVKKVNDEKSNPVSEEKVKVEEKSVKAKTPKVDKPKVEKKAPAKKKDTKATAKKKTTKSE